MFYLQQTGYDSNQFWKSFGFPLYVFVYSIALLIILPPFNFIKRKIAILSAILSLKTSGGLVKEGGEEDVEDAAEIGKLPLEKSYCKLFCEKFFNTRAQQDALMWNFFLEFFYLMALEIFVSIFMNIQAADKKGGDFMCAEDCLW
jgi:hypothetical protein